MNFLKFSLDAVKSSWVPLGSIYVGPAKLVWIYLDSIRFDWFEFDWLSSSLCSVSVTLSCVRLNFEFDVPKILRDFIYLILRTCDDNIRIYIEHLGGFRNQLWSALSTFGAQLSFPRNSYFEKKIPKIKVFIFIWVFLPQRKESKKKLFP